MPLHEAFETMQLARKPSNRTPPVQSSNDEPSWVANLVGQADPARNWHERQDARWDQGYGTQPYPFPPKSYAPVPYMPYPTPPHTAMLQNHDMAVIELARSKGLNPATFNCRPQSVSALTFRVLIEGSFLRYQVIHGGRCTEIAQTRNLVVHRARQQAIRRSLPRVSRHRTNLFILLGQRFEALLWRRADADTVSTACSSADRSVDENQTSTVWAQDKWKGIFRVKWIFVRDVPSA